MKKKIIKGLSLGIIAAAAAFLIVQAAGTFLAIYTPPESETVSTGNTGASPANQYNGQIFKATRSGTNTGITLLLPTGQRSNTPTNSIVYKLFNASGTELASKTLTNYNPNSTSTNSLWPQYFVQWDTPVAITAGQYYYYGEHYNSGTPPTRAYKLVGTYSDGCVYNGYTAGNTFSSSTCTGGSALDDWFEINDALSDAITMEFPDDESLVSNDFSTFQVRASYAYVDGDIKFRVRYGISEGLEFYDETDVSSSTPLIASNMLVSIDKSVALTAGFTYYARGELYRNGTLLASSGIVSFTILDPTDGTIGYIGTQPFTDDIASLFPNDDCSSFSGSIFSSSTLEGLGCISKNVFKDVLAFLFKPTELSLGFVNDTFNEFQTVFPFSIIFETKKAIDATIEDNLSGSPQTLTLDAVIGAGTSEEHTVSIDFYSDDILTNSFGATFKEFWYNTVIMFWILACLYAVVKHVLHHL